MPSIDLATLDRKIDRLTRLIEAQRPKAKTWVKVSVIQELTGWEGSSKMRWARENGLVQAEKTADGFMYQLESLNPLFIIKKSQA
jgi:hypothetical protein